MPEAAPSPSIDSAERVVIVMAMEAEAAPLRSALGAATIDPPGWAAMLPVRLAAAEPSGCPEVIVAVNGTDPYRKVDCIGSTAAALTTQVALAAATERWGSGPDVVLSIGTAGGWDRAGAKIGDVYLAWDRFVCHDRRIDLPGFDEFGRGDHPAADLRSHAHALGCRLGVVTTGDSLDESADDAARILDSGAEVKEMEAAAVAWVCRLHEVPCGAVKAITDLVDSPVATAAQFTEHLATAAASLQVTTLALLHRLAGTAA
ncbi:MAG: 5'-methylthioadenosine nucleosidase [Acidimicrobiales bacterium]